MHFRASAILVPLFANFFIMSSASSTVISSLTFEEVAYQAQVIVEAEVIPDSQWTRIDNGTPWTCQNFNIFRVLKGSVGKTKEVCFYGGQFGQYVFAASGLKLPTQGRRGFFFLYDTDIGLTNPMVGWEQGGFYIQTTQNGESVTTFSGEPISKITLNSSLAKDPPVPGSAIGIITGTIPIFSPAEFIAITLQILAGDSR